MPSEFASKTVAVIGGSAGLGLAIAKAFYREGAYVAIVGRDAERLGQAESIVRQESSGNGHISTHAYDVTCDQAVEALFEEIHTVHGHVHVLVNAVGVSDRAAILDVTPDQLRQAWELNLLAAVRCTRAAASDLLSTQGHLVNIGSLASKVAAPYLGTYPTTKFALAAYSQQLRVELGQRGLHVLLVCPGPIDRPDAGRRYETQSEGIPAQAAQPGGGAKLRRLDPNDIARQIVRACRDRRAELILPAKVRWLAALAQLFPSWADRILIRKTSGERSG